MRGAFVGHARGCWSARGDPLLPPRGRGRSLARHRVRGRGRARDDQTRERRGLRDRVGRALGPEDARPPHRPLPRAGRGRARPALQRARACPRRRHGEGSWVEGSARPAPRGRRAPRNRDRDRGEQLRETNRVQRARAHRRGRAFVGRPHAPHVREPAHGEGRRRGGRLRPRRSRSHAAGRAPRRRPSVERQSLDVCSLQRAARAGRPSRHGPPHAERPRQLALRRGRRGRGDARDRRARR